LLCAKFSFLCSNLWKGRGIPKYLSFSRQGACSWEWWPPEPSPEEWALVGLTDPAWDTSHANGNHADQGKEEGGEVPEPSPEEWALVRLTDPARDTSHANRNHADQGKEEGGEVPEPSPEEWTPPMDLVHT